MNNALILLADAAAAPAAGAAPAGGATQADPSAGAQLFSFLPLLLIFGLMFFFMWRSNKKEQKRRQEMIDSVRTGDKVLTLGGLYGIVSNIKDDIFVVKIADNVKIEVAKTAITSVSSKDAKEDEKGK